MKKKTTTQQDKPSCSQGVSGTQEWAGSNVNYQFGCQHDCLYCYAKSMAPRHGGIEIVEWASPVLRENVLERGYGKREKTIMFPTTHDLHPDQLQETLLVLGKLLKPGNKVLVVSKPHFEVIKAICDEFPEYQEQILFRFSIGAYSDKTLSFWEPNAPRLKERLNCLKHAYKQGFQTSVSIEPMLDNKVHLIIEAVEDWVTDSIWLGKMNMPTQRVKINGHYSPEVLGKVHQLIQWQSDEAIKALYKEYKGHKLVRWKESIKKVVGIDLSRETGLDR